VAKKFSRITRANLRKLPVGHALTEHSITFERLPDGDGRFSVNIMVDGIRIHRVIGKESEGTTREQAEEFITRARADARTDRLNLPKGRKTTLTLHKAAEDYIKKLLEEGGKDIPVKKRHFNQHLLPVLGNKPLAQISTSDIECYKKERQAEKAKNSTINRELSALSHLFTKAIEWRWISNKPCTIKRLKETPSRIIYLTIEQVKRFIDVAKQDQHPHLYPFIIIGLETAMRRMEILSIRIKDIDLHRQIIHIPKAKAGSREQPITKHLAEFLRGYIEAARPGQEWLLPSVGSRTGHTVNIEKPFRRAVKLAGLDPKTIVRHTLRHTAITHLVQAGVDLPTVKRISGHKTLSMVERYSHQNGAHIQAAMDKLQARYAN
jgi:integrase